jgi:GntR family transcriptional repressor for pyruvate dehydrogenase complex
MSSLLPPPPSKKHRTLAHHVVAHVSELMRNGSIQPGDKIPSETEIIAALGVSRSVVREAVSHMQAAGLVESRQGVGTFALAPAQRQMGLDPNSVVTMHDVLTLLELRITLETESAGFAATRHTDEQLERVRAALAQFLDCCKCGTDTAQADFAFHLAIAQASGNRYLHDVLSHLGGNILPRARLNSAKLTRDEPSVHIERVTREHDDIFNAIARRDAESARAAMRTHLSNSRERLKKAYELHEAASRPT